MGDRVSVAFKNDGWDGKDDVGVTLFHHWGGIEFPQVALKYAEELKAEMEQGDSHTSTPLSRLEPRTVMVDFIRWLWEHDWLVGKEFNTKNEYTPTGRACDSIYLGVNGNDGDNSDNGHWIVDLRNLTVAEG